MENKNRFLILEIRDTQWGEEVLMQYRPDPNDPKHDDLPSERLRVGREYNADFTPVEPDPVPEFNTGDKKK